MMSNDSTGGLHRRVENASSFYNANKGLLTAAATFIVGVGIVNYFNLPVMPPHEPAADIVRRAFEEGRGLEPFDEDAMVDRKDLVDGLGEILQPRNSKSYVVIVGEKGG